MGRWPINRHLKMIRCCCYKPFSTTCVRFVFQMVLLYMRNCLAAIMWQEVPAEGGTGTYLSCQRCCADLKCILSTYLRSDRTQGGSYPTGQVRRMEKRLHTGVEHQGGPSARTQLSTAP